MSDRTDQLKPRWHGIEPSRFRLAVAVAISLALHFALLLLQFGEYGEGLPGFEFPLGDRRARTPELHLNLQSTPQPLEKSAPAESTEQINKPPPDVDRPASREVHPGFDVVPLQTIKPTIPDPSFIAGHADHFSRPKPKLIISRDANSDFKVAQNDVDRDGVMPNDADTPVEETMKEAAPEPAVVPEQALPLIDSENQAKEAADKLAEQRKSEENLLRLHEEEELKKRLMEKQLAEKQANIEKQQQAVLQNEKIKKEEQTRQQLEREKVERAGLLAEQAQAEQRKLADIAQEQKMRQYQSAKEQMEHERLERVVYEKKQIEIEREKQEQLRQEQLKQEQLKQEQIKQEQLKQEQIKQEQIKQEQLKQEQIKQEQLKQEQLKQEQLKQEQIKQEQIKQEQIKQEQLKQERQLQLSRAEAQRQAEAQARSDQSKSQSNDLDELLGAPSNHGTGAGPKPDMEKILSGRAADFDKTGDSRSSTTGTALPAPRTAASPGTRQSIFGSKNGDVDLNLYIKSWRQKIERNGRLNFAQSAKDRMHTDPVVTVSIRSDGSVEGITILRSSGVPAMDEAIRRIVTVNAPYSVFPPGLARKFDVIDIRQIWIFDESLHVTDEMH